MDETMQLRATVADLLAILDECAGGRCEDATGAMALSKAQRSAIESARQMQRRLAGQ